MVIDYQHVAPCHAVAAVFIENGTTDWQSATKEGSCITSETRFIERTSALSTMICRLKPGVDSRVSSPNASR
jgi:hypothetical protein